MSAAGPFFLDRDRPPGSDGDTADTPGRCRRGLARRPGEPGRARDDRTGSVGRTRRTTEAVGPNGRDSFELGGAGGGRQGC
jgi:hypothetical protein